MIRSMSARNQWIVAFALWLLAGCGGETGTNAPPPPSECTQMVTVSVSQGTAPTFSWTPDCTIGRLIVEQADQETWGTETFGANSYRSPIHYGVHPPGSVEQQPPIALIAGNTYRVSLFRWIDAATESLQVLGVANFTP